MVKVKLKATNCELNHNMTTIQGHKTCPVECERQTQYAHIFSMLSLPCKMHPVYTHMRIGMRVAHISNEFEDLSSSPHKYMSRPVSGVIEVRLRRKQKYTNRTISEPQTTLRKLNKYLLLYLLTGN